ncbi:MAG: hypothetical protein JST04_13550 [Bdellovibrionales bacterium]|nr:hypothetical protein [Bdellovibrionales bacterium]
MKATLSLLIVGFAFYGSSSYAATPAEAAELGVHKVDRLITLKKINPSFTSQLTGMTSVATASGFNVTATEGAASDGSSRMLMMTAGKDGKILTYMEMGTKDPASPVVLPNNNALTLMELSMHCVEGELIAGSKRCAEFADAKMYNDHFKSAALTVKKDGTGKVIGADVAIKGDGLAKTLVVSLANDGTLIDIVEN